MQRRNFLQLGAAALGALALEQLADSGLYVPKRKLFALGGIRQPQPVEEQLWVALYQCDPRGADVITARVPLVRNAHGSYEARMPGTGYLGAIEATIPHPLDPTQPYHYRHHLGPLERRPVAAGDLFQVTADANHFGLSLDDL